MGSEMCIRDRYRPAAIRQLEVLAEEVGVDFFPSDIGQKPVAIVQAALAHARIKFSDVLIVDTAGRLAVETKGNSSDNCR